MFLYLVFPRANIAHLDIELVSVGWQEPENLTSVYAADFVAGADANSTDIHGNLVVLGGDDSTSCCRYSLVTFSTLSALDISC